MPDRLTGIVKWFDPDKGYGFITPDAPIDGLTRDLFVHVREVVGSALVAEQRVSFAVGEHRGRVCAAAVRVLGTAVAQ